MPFTRFTRGVHRNIFNSDLKALGTLFSNLTFSNVLVALLFREGSLSRAHARVAGRRTRSRFCDVLTRRRRIIENFSLRGEGAGRMVSQKQSYFER